jgi:hypothetical protein
VRTIRVSNINLSKSMPITCAFSCESKAYRITIRQQAAKISELEAELTYAIEILEVRGVDYDEVRTAYLLEGVIK